MKQVMAAFCLALAFAATADNRGQREERHERPHMEQPVERDLGEDHFAAGRTLSITLPVAGDLIAAGGQVDVKATVGGDALLMGGKMQVDGQIAQSLFLGGGQLKVTGQVGRNARVGGGQVEFGPASEVAGNLSVGGGDVTLRGRVGGYLQAASGTLLIDGVVDGDVEARAGELTLGPNARIVGKLRYASHEDLKRDPAAQVVGEVERINLEGGWPVPDNVERGMGRSGSWVWTLGLLVVAGVLVSALPGFTERLANTWRTRFPLSLLLGFVLVVCLPVAAVLFMVTVIGVPLGLLTLAAYPMLLLLGYVCSGLALGSWVATSLQQTWTQGSMGRVAAAALGVLAIGLLARVPFLGGLVMGVALLAGLGALGLQVWQSSRGRAA